MDGTGWVGWMDGTNVDMILCAQDGGHERLDALALLQPCDAEGLLIVRRFTSRRR